MVRGVTPDIRFEGFQSVVKVAPEQYHEKYEKIHQAGRSWLKMLKTTEITGLFLSGMNGSGKSAFSAWLLSKMGRGIRMTMVEAQEAFFSEWKIPPVLLGSYLVVLDEVGKEYTTKNGHSEMVLEHVVKFRSERRYPTVLISNGDMEDVVKRYGPTVGSVLEGRYLSIPFPNIDLRVVTGKENKRKFLKQCKEETDE